MTLSHVLASQDGLNAFMAALIFDGAWCVDCGHGTRMTSKTWARCKKCGQRVPRISSLSEDEGVLWICLMRESRGALVAPSKPTPEPR